MGSSENINKTKLAYGFIGIYDTLIIYPRQGSDRYDLDARPFY